MSVPVTFSPGKIDYGGVPPAADGPNINVDPSLGPPAISFSGGVSVRSAPADDHITAAIENDPAGIYRIRDIIVLEWTLEPVDSGDLPPGHHGRPPMVKVLEIVSQTQAPGPVAVTKDQYLLVRAAYRTPAVATSAGDLTATLVIQGAVWDPIRVPLSLHLAQVISSFPDTLSIVQGQQAPTPVFMQSIAGPSTTVTFQSSALQLHTGVTLDPNSFPLDPGQSLRRDLTFHASPDAPLGVNTLFIDQVAFNQRTGMLLSVNILAPLAPVPDPRVDHFDVEWVPQSTKRICQLTGSGDPEGKPHPNDTTRFALLGTDLGISFDFDSGGQNRTYFFFGDTNTGAGDQDGDSIAFTTDDNPESDGLHLQFIMGDNQWRRLVIPGISLGNFETPTGGFSHDNRLFVFATTGILKQDGAVYIQNSVLASATDAHNNFDLCFFVSHRNDPVDTRDTGGKFINIAAAKIRNDDWPGLPSNAAAGGEGIMLAGTGRYRQSAPFLAYLPLTPGVLPQKSELRYLSGFGFFEPGFGPNGPPFWSESETDAIPLFDDNIGEISLCWNEDLNRWLLVYGGCAAGKCGVLARSAPRAWGPWSATPQLIFEAGREQAQGKYIFECNPYGSYVITRYNRIDPVVEQPTIYYTLSNGSCRSDNDNSEPRYQVHLMKSGLRLISK